MDCSKLASERQLVAGVAGRDWIILNKPPPTAVLSVSLRYLDNVSLKKLD